MSLGLCLDQSIKLIVGREDVKLRRRVYLLESSDPSGCRSCRRKMSGWKYSLPMITTTPPILGHVPICSNSFAPMSFGINNNKVSYVICQ